MKIPVKVQDYWVPLSEASLDDKGVSLVESSVCVYKLDDISDQVCESLRGEKLSACDAFWDVLGDTFREVDGEYWFIEFKNSPARNIKQKQIWKKAFDSVSMVRMALRQNLTLDDLCGNAVYFVVYKDETPSPLEKIHQASAALAGKTGVLWELEKLKGILYRDIHTIPKSEFCRDWLPRMRGMGTDGSAPSDT